MSESVETDKTDEACLTLSIENVVNKFNQRKIVNKENLLEKPCQIIGRILFESKSKPWWLCVKALENYVDWLYTHTIDVAMLSLMLAVKMKLLDNDLMVIGMGTILHDIGKLLVPKSILLKPTELNDSEMRVVQQHCDLGMSTIADFQFPYEYTEIVLNHHERLDGSGYPRHLEAKDISSNVKIVMVADAFTAMTSYRPYRSAKSLEEALFELHKEKDKYPQDIVSLLEYILS